MGRSRSARCVAWVLTALALGALAPRPAHASVLYAYTSHCEARCANIGLVSGDLVGGFIAFSDEAAASGVAFSAADVVSFDLHFGDFAFDLSSLGSAFAVFAGPGRAGSMFQFVTNAAGAEPGYAFAETGWIAGASVDLAAFGGPGSLQLVAPEPAAPILAFTALVLGWLCWRRRVASVDAKLRFSAATARGPRCRADRR